MLRTSSYTIYVDLPDNSEEVLLIHGYTGAYDKVSSRVAAYVRSLEPRSRPGSPDMDQNLELPAKQETIPPPGETIAVLKRRGYLTEKTEQEEETLVCKMAAALHSVAMRIPSYVFLLTYNCNLRCPYCYQDHLRADTASGLLRANMQPELINRIFVAISKLEANLSVSDAQQNRPAPRQIKFYGGEPLLARNRPAVEYIINKALALGETELSAATNGTQLHAYRDLLGPGKLSSLLITLDGPPREHDKRRVHADGSGSFERIAQNVTMALERGVQVNLRTNVDRSNIGNLPELAGEMVARGWYRYDEFLAYAAPVSVGNAKTNTEMTMNSWELDKALAEMRQQYPEMLVIKRSVDSLRSQLRQIFERGADPRPLFKSSFCRAHSNRFIFDPYGDLYACWERTGDSKIRIGCIDENGEVSLNPEANRVWRSRTVISNPTCRRCRYAFYCGGGCAAQAHNHHNTYFASFCDGFTSRFRAGAAEAYLDFTTSTETALSSVPGCEMR